MSKVDGKELRQVVTWDVGTDKAYKVQVKFIGSQIPFSYEVSNLQSVAIGMRCKSREMGGRRLCSILISYHL